jgi:hypothetical protein
LSNSTILLRNAHFLPRKSPNRKGAHVPVPKLALEEANICLHKTAILFTVTKGLSQSTRK